MGSTTPPWRTLDPPSPTTTVDQRPGPPASTAPMPEVAPAGLPPVRVLAALGGAVACAALAVLLATTGGSGGELLVDGGSPLPGASDVAAIAEPSRPSGAVLIVEVVGAVPKPGVYRLPPGARVGDLVSAAGGYGARVDTARAERELNLAAALRDGDQVRVPSRDDPAGAAPTTGTSSGTGPAGGATAAASAPLDLNTATATELDALPGIGPVTADKILAARAEAPFTSVDDLRTRGLVGEKTFEKIRASLVVR